jgi:hypothetical protein
MKTETLYKKVGRKYVPVHAQWYEDDRVDFMKVGTFRLTYAYTDGGRRYEYDVTPATAPTVAAMMVAKHAMRDAINKRAQMRPSGYVSYTKRQLALIEQFKADMGGMYPSYWIGSSADDIADAAIKAVTYFNP